MRRFAGSCRFVYNKALALQKERYERAESKLGYTGLCQQLTSWKQEVACRAACQQPHQQQS